MNTTTSTPEPIKAPPLEKQTTVGNYFVSNYPPFSFWKPERSSDLLAALERPPKPGNPLGVYLHIPFCRKRCHFCYFRVYTDKDSAAIKSYIDATLQGICDLRRKAGHQGPQAELHLFRRRHAIVSFRGPASASDRRHEGAAAVGRGEEVAFEAEPGTLTDHKLKAIREMGVTRLSLGVENFDDHILEINGRAHHSKEIARAYGFARELNFPQINIDLIAGMVEETEANWRECVRKTIEMSPDSVTIYEMEIPYNTTIYKQMKAEGKLVAPVADWDTKRGWVDYAFTELEKAGYTVSSAYTAVKDPQRTKFIYRDRLWAGADLLSLGVASFGHINGTHYQNHHDFDPYVARVQQGELPVYRALTPNDDERLIREFVLQLKLGHVSRDYFKQKFGVEPAERFAAPLQTLKDWGFLAVDGDTIRLNREGLLQVDRLLHEFFLPATSQRPICLKKPPSSTAAAPPIFHLCIRWMNFTRRRASRCRR